MVRLRGASTPHPLEAAPWWVSQSLWPRRTTAGALTALAFTHLTPERTVMTTSLPERTPTGLLIGGDWLTTATHLDVVNPATLGTLAEIGDASWFSEEAAHVQGDFRYSPSGDKTIITDYRPMGVAYLITPWNFPAAMATRKLAPAMAAGCTSILKPAQETPLTALWVADVLERAGAPAGVVNVITTSTSGPVSEAILSDPRVATLSFTGSTYVGKLLLEQTAQRVLPSSMELGGNAPFLVLEGADVDSAVEGAMVAKMRNGGSACTAANRFYIHASLADEFATKFEAALRGLKIGPGVDQSNDLGAMVSVKERDKILEFVQAAESEGTTPTMAGDAPSDGAFIAPYIVRGVEHGSTLTRNEIFGPVAPIVTFEDPADGIRMANDTEYGLISYVFAKDAGEGIKVARQMESGMVAINRGIASDPAASFGGMKESGLGREGGFDGIHEFLETQYFAVDL
ncbi:MAG: aldehyde dehydrogenase family protein [Actinobacteria bacterium]|nr:aldehyde dehydrogenase family protein [Actinomycetota bacterium]